MTYLATIIASIALAVSGWFGLHINEENVGANQTISSLSSLSTPVDADSLPIVDTTAVPATTKRLTWSNLKATSKSYFDGIYPQKTGSTTITTLGTISTGVWNGTAIPVGYGGTGTTSPTLNQIMIGNASSGFKVIDYGTSGQFLTSAGSGSAPSWTTSSVSLGANNTWTGTNTFNATTSIGTSYTDIRINAFTGDGSDGDVTITSGTTTLARDMYYNNLTINAGTGLIPNGYRIYVKNTLINNGNIWFNGNNGGNASGNTGGTAGAVLTSGTIYGGIVGKAGANSSATTNRSGTAGSNGDSQTESICSNGVAGGQGGDANTGGYVGGAGGTAGSVTASLQGIKTIQTATLLRDFAGENIVKYIKCGGGSGSGGSGAASGGSALTGGAGGGSGGGGGTILIVVKTITNNGFIYSLGGNGGNGTDASGVVAGGGGGGGGGGDGGNIILIYNTATLGTISVAGGNGGIGGNGIGSGSAGSNGTAGASGTTTYIQI